MSKFGIMMVLKTSPMPPDKRYEAMVAIRQGFEEAAKAMGCEVEVKVVPMPEDYDLRDLRDILIASA